MPTQSPNIVLLRIANKGRRRRRRCRRCRRCRRRSYRTTVSEGTEEEDAGCSIDSSLRPLQPLPSPPPFPLPPSPFLFPLADLASPAPPPPPNRGQRSHSPQLINSRGLGFERYILTMPRSVSGLCIYHFSQPCIPLDDPLPRDKRNKQTMRSSPLESLCPHGEVPFGG